MDENGSSNSLTAVARFGKNFKTDCTVHNLSSTSMSMISVYFSDYYDG